MSWENYKIGDFLTRSKEPVRIKAQEEYTLVTIRMYHKGVAKRSHVKGSSIKSPTLYRVRAGQFILSGIDARNRAFGIVPEELEGAIVTNDFWTHDIDTSIIDINFFYWFTTTPQFYEACIKASEGTTNRQRLQADKFYSFDVPLPSIDEQKEWVERISYIQNKHEQLDKELDQQQTYLQLLRQIILQEAVQGKVTKQDPTDEPATELLKRIKAEKLKLIKAGKFKNEKELRPIPKDVIPFELPVGWVWCRLGELVNDFLGGFAFKSSDLIKEGRNQVLRLGNVKNDKALLTANPVYIDDKIAALASSNELLIEDILITMTGTRLKRDYCFTVLLKESDFNGKRLFLNQRVGCLRMSKSLNVQFINIALKADNILDNIFEDETGTANQGNIGVTTIKSCLFPLPPLAEQQRIVAKVQQLQQQLSQLEAQVQQSRQYAKQLLQSVLKEAFEQKGKVYEIQEGQLNLVAE
jgi:restriction endonuclease S subunit